MIKPDAFRPLPKKQVISPWYGMSKSMDLLSSPFDAWEKVRNGLSHCFNVLFVRQSQS